VREGEREGRRGSTEKLGGTEVHGVKRVHAFFFPCNSIPPSFSAEPF
jgi:hypothetical protein